jgi:hypothetical protein
MPMRDGTIELRQKGQSFRLFRELLATVGVAVGAAIFAWFLAELSHNSASALQRQRFARGRTPVQNTIRVQSAAVSPATVAMTGNLPLMLPPILRLSHDHRCRESIRTIAPSRPYIADPRNLWSNQFLMNKQINLVINTQGKSERAIAAQPRLTCSSTSLMRSVSLIGPF